MKQILVYAACVAFAFTGTSIAAPLKTTDIKVVESTVSHGGGCRRTSPPGQCCHMETRTGIVHCH